MGQARARGTLQQRKVAAVIAGRIKTNLPLWHWGKPRISHLSPLVSRQKIYTRGEPTSSRIGGLLG
jgi:hypothetical protein